MSPRPAATPTRLTLFPAQATGRSTMTTGKKIARGMWSTPRLSSPMRFWKATSYQTAPNEAGIVTIEVYVCYDMIMNLPFISNFIPSPFRIHTYTVMPAPEAIPTPTPIPSPSRYGKRIICMI